MKTIPLYAALDLHCNQSVLGSMDHDGNLLGQTRFGTDAGQLKEQIAALGSKHRRPVYLTLEAGSLTRWAVGIVRPLVERVIICDPRHNRLINSNPNKSDEVDVAPKAFGAAPGQAQRSMDGKRTHPRDLPRPGL